jgi:signal transduction histidine kinase
VLNNFVNNALKYCHQPSDVVLSVDVISDILDDAKSEKNKIEIPVLLKELYKTLKEEEKEKNKISPLTQIKMSHVKFSVKDSGPGISPEKQTKLFREFSEVGRCVGVCVFLFTLTTAPSSSLTV